MDLAALIQEFLVDCRARRLSPKTIGWYADNLRYFLDWLAAQGDQPTLAAFTLCPGYLQYPLCCSRPILFRERLPHYGCWM